MPKTLLLSIIIGAYIFNRACPIESVVAYLEVGTLVMNWRFSLRSPGKSNWEQCNRAGHRDEQRQILYMPEKLTGP
jgi:hypothetical protein